MKGSEITWENMIALAVHQAMAASDASVRSKLYLEIAAEIRLHETMQSENFNRFRESLAQSS